MAHSIFIQPKGAYLHVTVTGDNTPEDIGEYFKEVLEACQQNHCFNILIEEYMHGPTIGAFPTFEVITQNVSLLLPYEHHLAYVDTNIEHGEANSQFGETVAVNRGLNVRVFSNAPEAEEWLLEQSKIKH